MNRSRGKFILLPLFAMVITGCSFSSFIPSEEEIKEGTTYTFISKSWETNSDKWISNKNGARYENGKGVQINTATSGASATSQTSFEAVSFVNVRYTASEYRGSGSIDVYIGENKIGSQNISNAGSSLKNLKFTSDESLDGAVRFVVNCVTSSIYIYSVTIKEGEKVPTNPTNINIGNDFSLTNGKSKQLKVTYTPKNANQNLDVKWSSSDSDIASVSDTGLVSGLNIGSATITATLKYDENIKTSVVVTVTEQILDAYTVLIYICGSDLESTYNSYSKSYSGLASKDIKEILSVKNQPEDVNIVIETGGAKHWDKTYNINNKKLQRHHVRDGKLITDETLDNASMGNPSTLQSFLEYGFENYPAEKTALILWNHGGALSGVCSDENFVIDGNYDALLASEVKSAIEGAFETANLKVGEDKLEWIGYDACLMAVQDIAEINSKYFNYMVCSQESEAGEGWEYSSWVDDLYAGKDTNTILKAICDGFIKSYDDTYGKQGYDNDQTLSYLDLTKIDAYKTAFESLAASISSVAKANSSNFITMMKTVKNYGGEYCDKDYYHELLGYGYQSSWFEYVVMDGEAYYYLPGYYDFGVFDIKDTLNKIKANHNFSNFVNDINTVIKKLDELVVYSTTGEEAGESNGLCLVCPMDEYFEYNEKETNFVNWRNMVNSIEL